VHVRLSDGDRHALCGLLAHKAGAITADPDATFVARTLAERYDRLRTELAALRERRGVVGLRVTSADARCLETLLEHEARAHGNEHYIDALASLRRARRPKADPRRVNGRRVRVAS
jgi:hypothetical protein